MHVPLTAAMVHPRKDIKININTENQYKSVILMDRTIPESGNTIELFYTSITIT